VRAARRAMARSGAGVPGLTPVARNRLAVPSRARLRKQFGHVLVTALPHVVVTCSASDTRRSPREHEERAVPTFPSRGTACGAAFSESGHGMRCLLFQVGARHAVPPFPSRGTACGAAFALPSAAARVGGAATAPGPLCPARPQRSVPGCPCSCSSGHGQPAGRVSSGDPVMALLRCQA
jgi:hypothetical protein